MNNSAIKTLKAMALDPSLEIAQSGIIVWLGERKISYLTYKQLRDAAALSCDRIGDTNYCTINETGRSIARRPELAEEIMNQWFKGKAFTIQDDRIYLLGDSKPH